MLSDYGEIPFYVRRHSPRILESDTGDADHGRCSRRVRVEILEDDPLLG